MSWQILLKKVNHREIYLHPTLSSVDFSDEGEFRTPQEVSGPLDPRKPNDNWISGCKPCYKKKQEEAMRD